MNSMNIKKGDTVRVLSGKDKGKEGQVVRSLPSKQRVVVEKVNMVKKAMRPTQQNPQGGIMSVEAPIHVSNVMVICPECKQPTRVSHRVNEAGKKVRVCKKCGKDLQGLAGNEAASARVQATWPLPPWRPGTQGRKSCV